MNSTIFGVPTESKRPGERYSEVYSMDTSDDPCGLIRVQWHRFGPESPIGAKIVAFWDI